MMLDGLWYDESNQTVSAEKLQITANFERASESLIAHICSPNMELSPFLPITV
jgi:hypothetical protein